MADNKVVVVTANTPLVNNPEVNITTTVVPIQITAEISSTAVPGIDGEIPIMVSIAPVSITTNIVSTTVPNSVSDTQLDVIITGLGEENIPDPRLFKFIADEFGLDERLVKQAFKSLQDVTTSTEQARKLLQKVVTDATTNSELFTKVWNAFRQNTETITSSELLQKDFAKVLLNVVDSPDLFKTSFGKYLVDVTQFASLSYAVILVGKNLQDQTISLTDVLSRIVTYNRTFTDSVFMTDDFLGAANVDDDQFAIVYKVVLEWLEITETVALAVTKPDILDVSVVTEQAYLHPSLQKLDQSNFADTQSSDVELVKLETLSPIEEQVFDVTKPDLLDTAIAQEQIVLGPEIPKADSIDILDTAIVLVNSFQQDITTTQEDTIFETEVTKLDTASTIDSISKSTNKALTTDLLSVSELLLTKLIGLNINEIDYFLEDYVFDLTDYTFKAVHATDAITNFVIAKGLQDLVDATDDFLGSANIDDDQIAAFDKVVVDYVGFYEAFNRVVTYVRLFTDTAQALEQIELLTQKPFTDQTTNTDIAVLDTNKQNLETTSTQERTSFDLTQNTLDEFLPQEQIALTALVPKTDVFNNSDVVTKFYEAVRQFTELTNSTIRVEKLLETVNIDLSTVTELFNKTTAKVLANETTNTEQLAFDFQASYYDSVDATDDFFGSANIDDDQIAAFDKVVVDYAVSYEAVVTVAEFYRVFAEISSTTDTATLVFAKALLDTTITSETIAKNITTTQQELFTSLDVLAVSFETTRQEAVSPIDLVTQVIDVNKLETAVTQEAVLFNTELTKLETAVTTETTAKDFATARQDTVAILESFITEFVAYRDFYESVTQTDTVTLTPAKNLNEVTTNTELLEFAANKTLLDVTDTSETLAKSVNTEFSELLDATDDFAGAANIDDDQYAEFQKSISDYATASEVFSTLVTYLRTVTESQILSDVVAVSSNKALSDTTNSSDTVTLLNTLPKTESVSTSQTISLTLQSYFSENYAELGYTGETYTY